MEAHDDSVSSRPDRGTYSLRVTSAGTSAPEGDGGTLYGGIHGTLDATLPLPDSLVVGVHTLHVTF
jgi:hypothetical protein